MSRRARTRAVDAHAGPILLAAALATLALGATPAEAQSKLRRPYAETYRLNYGFDNNGGASGCTDYACMGACYDGHTGSDFGTPYGTTVLAGAAGRVVARNDGCADYGYLGNTCGGRCGNYVQLEHDDGTRTIYCHMKNGSVAVSLGARVSCGQRLGQSASSGNSTGPHLHVGWRNRSGASDDSFAGSCGGPYSAWVQQRGYREAPGTSCDCVAATEVCNGRDDDCDGAVDENATAEVCNGRDDDCDGAVDENATAEVCNGADDDCDGEADEDEICEVTLLHEQPGVYARPARTDVDGDGLSDVCARGYAGVRCFRSDGDGFAELGEPVPFGDESGWADPANYATLRMGDIDGDGLDDVCARADAGVVCARSTGGGFGPHEAWQPELSDEAGFGGPDRYTTLRLADVDGDGKADLCARGAEGFSCWLSDGAAFATPFPGPAWSDANGWGSARYYGTIRMGDLDGDGKADVCARAAAGVVCALSDGAGLTRTVEGPAFGDADGFGELSRWSTLRLADVDGDGRADVCARGAAALLCARFDGAAFGPVEEVAPLGDDSGWADPSNYATLRVGDVDGDGADELCLRANAGVRCYGREPEGWGSIEGPALSDDAGWAAPRYYETLRLSDTDGNGTADLCARDAAGWRCWPSDGAGFGEAVLLDEMDDARGWDAPEYWSTVLASSRTCAPRAEECNGRDDDCDGEVDEDACVDLGQPPMAPPPARGESPDGARESAGPARGDAISGGCACVAPGADGHGAWLGLLCALVGARRRRRRPGPT